MLPIRVGRVAGRNVFRPIARNMSYKPMYTTSVTSTGGRNGKARSSDGLLDVKLEKPKELGGSATPSGTNPEQLFGAAYSACFQGAMGVAAGKLKKTLPPSTEVEAVVTLGKDDASKLVLQAELKIKMEGMARPDAEAIVQEAHQICPFSHATRGNVQVKLTVL